MTSAASLDNPLPDVYRSPPRPLPYDAEPLNSADNWNECAREDELKIYRSKSASRASISKIYTWSWYSRNNSTQKYRVSRAWDESTDLETINTQQVHSSTSENATNLFLDVHGLPEASVSNAEIKPNDSPYHNGVEHVLLQAPSNTVRFR
ncbi:hypothetical protein KIW84_056472 [Lathyrus oleraceus]|uniref:Uncharacterized protein n=1 Tax=Pisum sativum TaxID=3888 RepID=A0A9D4X0M9_PEA|nr:hypothetical protein KIW84_056470 [Pisum sativum]KAI5411395.1 hypothetical protein KIW84_056472 [Pisum sativum]